MMKEKIYVATMKEILEIELPMFFYQSNNFDRERERTNGQIFSDCATFKVCVFLIIRHQSIRITKIEL